ncbi:MAG: DUF2076 domain-containing protein [Sodalis sp. (in: enterobacteria)]
MQSEEKLLIERLFQRIKKVEQSAGSRNAEAERQIQRFIQQQPIAPYYMVQAILMQEAALTRMHHQIQQLKNEISQLQAIQKHSNGGFFSSLFGSGRSKQLSQPQLETRPSNHNGYLQSSSNISRGGSFMSGALQSAVGVAGGVMLGNMLNNMFHHSSSEEIANIIDNSTAPIASESDSLLNQNFDAGNLETFNHISEGHFLDQNDPLSNNEFCADDFSNSDDEFI